MATIAWLAFLATIRGERPDLRLRGLIDLQVDPS